MVMTKFKKRRMEQFFKFFCIDLKITAIHMFTDYILFLKIYNRIIYLDAINTLALHLGITFGNIIQYFNY